MKKLIAILCFALFLLAACGQEATTVAKETEVKVENKVVKFGWLAPLSGDVATFAAPVKDATLLAVEEVNKNNIIPGKTLEIVFEDSVCDGKKAATGAEKLANHDKVPAVIGGFCSGGTLAAAPIFEAAKVLAMSPGSTNPAIKDSGDYIFRIVPSDSGQGKEGAELASKFGKKVALLVVQNDWGQGVSHSFTAEANNIGLELMTEEYAPGERDFKTSLVKVKSFEPDVVYMASYPTDAAILLKQLDEAGITAQKIGADAMKDDNLLSIGEDLIVTLPGVPDSPELKSFADAYKAKYGKDYEAYTPEGYDVVMILAKACGATDCTSTAMKEYLYNMGEYSGASGTFEFDEFGEVEKPYDYFQVKNGEWVEYNFKAE